MTARIPNSDRAVIEPIKLHSYLLSTSHPVGRFKAAFFLSLGYTSDAWQRLESDLRLQHLTQETELRETTAYGQKYEIRATLMGPAGIPADVVSVWIVLKDEEVPRFITAYPGGDR